MSPVLDNTTSLQVAPAVATSTIADLSTVLVVFPLIKKSSHPPLAGNVVKNAALPAELVGETVRLVASGMFLISTSTPPGKLRLFPKTVLGLAILALQGVNEVVFT